MPNIEVGGIPVSAVAAAPVRKTIHYIPNFEQSVTSSYPVTPTFETTRAEILSFDQFTLSHVPPPDERKTILNGIGISDFVIRHEVGHAVAGIAKSKPVIELNFNPNMKGAQAFVKFGTPVDPITAAAGAALTGSNYGTGGDQATVAYFGASWETSVSNASGLINNSFNGNVIERVIDLTKYIATNSDGVISGVVFDQIIQRAQEELAHEERHKNDPNPYAWLKFDHEKIEENRIKWLHEVEAFHQSPSPDTYEKEILYDNGDIVIEYWVKGKLEKTEEICSICGHVNGHSIEIHQWYALLNQYAQTPTEESATPTGFDMIYGYRQPDLVKPEKELVEV